VIRRTALGAQGRQKSHCQPLLQPVTQQRPAEQLPEAHEVPPVHVPPSLIWHTPSRYQKSAERVLISVALDLHLRSVPLGKLSNHPVSTPTEMWAFFRAFRPATSPVDGVKACAHGIPFGFRRASPARTKRRGLRATRRRPRLLVDGRGLIDARAPRTSCLCDESTNSRMIASSGLPSLSASS
jgi:hypothetical protein